MTCYCGRIFTSDEIGQIRHLIQEDSSRNRAELSRLTCRMLKWYKSNGGLKDMSCRVAYATYGKRRFDPTASANM